MQRSVFPGHILREQREAMGFSLADLYQHIHVPAEYIAALEEARLDALPSPIYVNGYLNSYCELLGLEAAPFLASYRIHGNPAHNGRRQEASSRAPRWLPRLPWMEEAVAWAAICAILLFSWMAYSVVVKPLAEPPTTPLEAGSVEVVVPETHFGESAH